MSGESPASVLVDATTGTPIGTTNNLGVYYQGVAAVQDVKTSTNNSSTVALASGASFTGIFDSTFGVAAIQVCVYADQPLNVQVQQSQDHSNWDIIDSYDLPPNVGDGRTTQAVAEYMRVVVTNLGPVATGAGQLRIQTILCPVVEALPRSLTPLTGALKLSRSTRSFTPDPKNFQKIGEARALSLDVRRALCTRSTALTDEGSFRDDFSTVGKYVDLTGVCYFRNGQVHVTGIGTNFLAEVKIGQLLKLTADPDADLTMVQDVFSNTDLILETAYLGSTANGVGKIADWLYITGAGGSITIAASIVTMDSGVTGGEWTGARHAGDYLPFLLGFRSKLSQRIVNQEAHVGFLDDVPGFEQKQACFVWNGVDPTKVICRTSFSGSDVEDTTVMIDNGGVTSDYHNYEVIALATKCVFLIDGLRVAEHSVHVPGPYDTMDQRMAIINTGVPASPTTLDVDATWLVNFDRLEISARSNEEPIRTRYVRSSIPAVTSVAAAALDTKVLDYNDNRLGATLFNDSSSACYVKFGSGASATSYTVRMAENGYYEVPFNYVGQINAFWVTGAGAMRVTELT